MRGPNDLPSEAKDPMGGVSDLLCGARAGQAIR